MSKKDSMNIILSTEVDGIIESVKTDDYVEAHKRFEELAKQNVKVKLEWENVPCNIMIEHNGWNNTSEIALAKATTRNTIKTRLMNSGVPADKIAAVMTMSLEDIITAVIAKNTEAFTDLKGVGEKTAEKVIAALHGKVTYGAIPIGNTRKQYHQRVRCTLNPNYGKNGDMRMWVFDSVRKRWSNVEAYATAISGDENCIINVVSTIPELSAPKWDVASRDRADIKTQVWNDVCHDGLKLNKRTYVFIGHGTNAAKENSTLWCLAEYADDICKHFAHNVNEGWKITDAKYIAYLIGLQAVYAEPVALPIRPEDFEIFPSLIQEIIDDVCQNHLDGTVTFIKNGKVKQNQFDGFSVFNVSAKMQNRMIERLVESGYEREEAIRIVNNELAILRGHTIRTKEMAVKGAVYTNFDIHSFFHDRGIHTLHGRDIDDIVIFSDETVLKTAIGEGKAYETREAWINAVKDNFQYCKLLCEHDLKKKDIPYQVIQTAHKADPGTVRALAEEQAANINKMHTLEGAKRTLSKEQRALVDFMPEAAKTRYLSGRMEKNFYSTVDDAFSGKVIGQCFGMLLAPDVVAFAEHVGGLEVKGFLEAGEACCFKMSNGEFAFWRNPVLDPGALRVLTNRKKVPEELRKYFHFDTSMMMINIKDTTITRVRGDYDGDKGSCSKNRNVIEMFKECHRNFGDWLTDWDDIPAEKGKVTRKTQLDYAATLCHESTLGKTCCGLNRLYAGKAVVDGKDIEHFEATYDEVSNLTTLANNLVDAGKHGAKKFVMMESAEAKITKTKQYEPLHPNAKNYRDLHDSMAKALARGGSREELDKMAVSTLPRYGTLDTYTGTISDMVDRSFHIDDLPEGEFDVKKLMYNPEFGLRGMRGLIRKGDIYIEELGYRVDEGLFNSICRRSARDWEIVENENPTEPDRNMKESTFFGKCRAQGLAEIEAFANACGKTLKDAFDVITRWVFCFAPNLYANDGSVNGEKMDILFDQLMRGYWVIFGGMVEDRIAELTEEAVCEAV